MSLKKLLFALFFFLGLLGNSATACQIKSPYMFDIRSEVIEQLLAEMQVKNTINTVEKTRQRVIFNTSESPITASGAIVHTIVNRQSILKQITQAIYTLEPYLSECDNEIERIFNFLREFNLLFKRIAELHSRFKFQAGLGLTDAEAQLVQQQFDLHIDQYKDWKNQQQHTGLINVILGDLSVWRPNRTKGFYYLRTSSSLREAEYKFFGRNLKKADYNFLKDLNDLARFLYADIPLRFRRGITNPIFSSINWLFDSLSTNKITAFIRYTTLFLVLGYLIYRRVKIKGSILRRE